MFGPFPKFAAKLQHLFHIYVQKLTKKVHNFPKVHFLIEIHTLHHRKVRIQRLFYPGDIAVRSQMICVSVGFLPIRLAF